MKVSQNSQGRMLEEGRACWLPEDGDAELASSLTTSRRACRVRERRRKGQDRRNQGLLRTPGLSTGVMAAQA